MKLPIRDQILWPLTSLLLVAVAANAIFSAWWASSRTLQSLEARQGQIIGAIEESSFPLSPGVMDKLRRLTGEEFVVWDASEQRPVVGTLPDDETTRRDLGDVAAATQIGKQLRRTIGGTTYVVRAGRIRLTPAHQLLVLTPDDVLRRASRSAIWPPLAVGTLTIISSIPLVVLLSSNWARRIRSLEQHVGTIAQGEFGRELGTGAIDDELERLVASINSMSRQLDAMRQELIRGERTRLVAQLAAGFAHQLRNGLAGAKLAIQLHQSRCGASSDSSLDVACQQLSLVEEEVRGLLSLGKDNARARTSVDLKALIGVIENLVMPACRHQGVEFSIDWQTDRAVVTGLADGLRAAILNITLNAIEAAGPGGHVWLTTEMKDSQLAIVVDDDGPGPPDELAASMFDSFMTSKQEGIGLGLAVAMAVARDHQGSLEWRRIGKRTRFELRLPIASSTEDER